MGTIVNELLIDAPMPASQKGQLTFGYHHIKYGDGQITVDEETFDPISSGIIHKPYPNSLDYVRSSFPGILVHKAFDKGVAPNGKQYLLRWEALQPNRDQKPEGTLPLPSQLELIAY